MLGGNAPQDNISAVDKQSLDVQERLGMAEIGTRDDTAYQQERTEREDLTRWQQDLESDLTSLKFNLRSWIKNDDGDWVAQKEEVFIKGMSVSQSIKPLMNDRGINTMITTVRRYLTRNMMMSNLNQDIIFRILRTLKVTLVLNIGEKHDVYGVEEADLKLIIKMIMDTVEPTLYRALNNGERRYLNTINRRVETFADSAPPQQRQGLKGLRGGF